MNLSIDMAEKRYGIPQLIYIKKWLTTSADLREKKRSNFPKVDGFQDRINREATPLLIIYPFFTH